MVTIIASHDRQSPVEDGWSERDRDGEPAAGQCAIAQGEEIGKLELYTLAS